MASSAKNSVDRSWRDSSSYKKWDCVRIFLCWKLRGSRILGYCSDNHFLYFFRSLFRPSNARSIFNLSKEEFLANIRIVSSFFCRFAESIYRRSERSVAVIISGILWPVSSIVRAWIRVPTSWVIGAILEFPFDYITSTPACIEHQNRSEAYRATFWWLSLLRVPASQVFGAWKAGRVLRPIPRMQNCRKIPY